MNNYKNRHRIWIKITAMVVVCLFAINSFLLTDPASGMRINRNTLAVQSRFAALINEGIMPTFQRRFEILAGIRLLLAGKTYSAVNGMLIEKHGDGIKRGESNIKFLPGVERDTEGEKIKARFFVKERKDVVFEMEYADTTTDAVMDRERQPEDEINVMDARLHELLPLEQLHWGNVFQANDTVVIRKVNTDISSEQGKPGVIFLGDDGLRSFIENINNGYRLGLWMYYELYNEKNGRKIAELFVPTEITKNIAAISEHYGTEQTIHALSEKAQSVEEKLMVFLSAMGMKKFGEVSNFINKTDVAYFRGLLEKLEGIGLDESEIGGVVYMLFGGPEEIKSQARTEAYSKLIGILQKANYTKPVIRGFLMGLVFKVLRGATISNETTFEGYNTVIEEILIKRIDLFTPELVKELADIFTNVAAVKYMVHYARLHGRATKIEDLPAFPSASIFQQIMHSGAKRVMFMHNLDDAMGNEIIRASLIQSLLDYNPELKVVIYTKHGFLYSHSRVEVRSVDEFDVEDMEYDMIINYYQAERCQSNEVEIALEEKLRKINFHKNPDTVYIKTGKERKDFTYNRVIVGSMEIEQPRYRFSNAYVPTYRLCVNLGLPCRHFDSLNVEKNRESLFTGLPAPQSLQIIWDEIDKRRKMIRKNDMPVALFNCFGGTYENKGYDRSFEGQKQLLEDIMEITSRGIFVVILPNGKEWGTVEIAENIVEMLPDDVKNYVLVAPSPANKDKLPGYFIGKEQEISEQDISILTKYLIEKVQLVVTVEGGCMHLAGAMKKKMLAIGMEGSGDLQHWFPACSEFYQQYVDKISSEKGRGFIEDMVELLVNIPKKTKQNVDKQNGIERNLLIKTRHLKKHPVNMYIDLSNIPREENQLEENMETLALSIKWQNTFGLNIRYVLENDENGQAEKMLKDKLGEVLASRVGNPYVVGETIETKDGGKIKVEKDELIDIRLENMEGIKEDREINDREYIVALKDDSSKPGIAIPNYTAAAAMGLSLAALRVAWDKVPKRQGEEKGSVAVDKSSREWKEYKKLSGKIVDKFRDIYKRYDVIASKDDFSEDELELMVMGSSATKLYYTVLYALPPVVKVIEAIYKYHEMMRDVLIAA
ncbi:MAG: hypothetical protein JSW62_02015 [Thermoplasmatales archaeon]|nr:MAG: hypothetical protein JSW62_02015 [Thermoplasmatales archaeon]